MAAARRSFKDMSDFFSNSSSREKTLASGKMAKDRLRVIVYHDRVNTSYPFLNRMKEEIVQVITKFVDIDQESLDMNFHVEGDTEVLAMSIPILAGRPKREFR